MSFRAFAFTRRLASLLATLAIASPANCLHFPGNAARVMARNISPTAAYLGTVTPSLHVTKRSVP